MLRKAFTILLSFVICFLAGQIVSSIIAITTNFTAVGDISSITPEMTREINLLKLIQFVSSIFTFIVASFVVAKFTSDNSFDFLKIRTSPNGTYYLLTFLFMIASIPMLNLIIEWNDSIVFPSWLKDIEYYMRDMEDANQNISNLILTGTSIKDLFVNLCVIALIPAIGEELLFRGVLQRFFGEWFKNPHIAIFITAFIFSAIHFQFYGFIPRLLLGMFFGYLVYSTNSLWPAIFAHFTNNGMAVIAQFLINKGIISDEINSLGAETSDIYYIIIGIATAIFIGRYLFKKQPDHIKNNIP